MQSQAKRSKAKQGEAMQRPRKAMRSKQEKTNRGLARQVKERQGQGRRSKAKLGKGRPSRAKPHWQSDHFPNSSELGKVAVLLAAQLTCSRVAAAATRPLINYLDRSRNRHKHTRRNYLSDASSPGWLAVWAWAYRLWAPSRRERMALTVCEVNQ